MKTKLMKDLSVARPIYKQIENMYLRMYAIEDKKPIVFPHPIFYSIVLTLLWATSASICWNLLFLPFQLLHSIFGESKMVIGIYFLISFVIGPIFLIRFLNKQRIKHYDKKIDKIQQEINDYIEENDCAELYCVPEDCRNYQATNYIYEALRSGRADTLKEAMIQYEQQKQIWKLENKLNQQMQQVERLQRDIGYALSCIR